MGDPLWFYEEAGKQAGPVTQAALADAIRTGRLAAGMRVWRAGMAGWLPWEQAPELVALVAPPPLAPPPEAAARPEPGPGHAAPQGWGPPAAPGGWGAPPPPGPSAGAPGPMAAAGMARVEVRLTILFTVLTLGLYGLVKFYQCGMAYARLVPARPSGFERLFWLHLGLALAGILADVVSGPLGIAFGLGSLVAGLFLLGEVLAARAALVAASGARVELASDGTHKALWVAGELLAVLVVGIFLLAAQAVLFFGDHDKLADALARRG